MPSSAIRNAATGAAGRLAVVAAAAGASAYLVAVQPPAEGGAEGWYLVLTGSLLLAALALLAPQPAIELSLAALGLPVLLWVLPALPLRGALLHGGLLVAALAAAVHRFRRADTLPFTPLYGVALAVQVGAASERLLPRTVGLTDALVVLALPAVAAAATWALVRRRGAVPALVVLAAAAAGGPGFTPATTLGLVALAAGSELGAAPRPRWWWAVAAVVLLLPLPWLPRPGLLALAAALALALPGRKGAAVAGAAAIAAVLMPAAGPGRLWLVAVLLPAAAVPGAVPLEFLVRGVLLAGAGAVGVAGGSGPALAAGVLALGLRDVEARRLQLAWSTVLATMVTLLAAYPWLRARPLEDAFRLLPTGPGWKAGVAALLLFPLLAATGRRALTGLGVVLVLAAGWSLPTGPELLQGTTVTLDAGHRLWREEVAEPRVGSVVVDSSLANAAQAPPGTVVATVDLELGDGAELSFPLRAGEDTGEWAVHKPGLPPVTAPPPWLSFVEAGGGFFGQQYRSRYRLQPAAVQAVEVKVAPGLPQGASLSLFAVELRGPRW